MDGQQVSNEIGTGAQPRYSQDAIAEFQYLANRFDATQGRTSGVQVNAITKSGTNDLTGLFRANFRNSDWFDAEEPVLKRKVPLDNQQYSVAAGGPIIRDKLHFFGNFEYRAGAAQQHLEHSLLRIQRRTERHADREDRRRPGGLPDFV